MNFKTCTFVLIGLSILIVALSYFEFARWQTVFFPLVIWLMITALGAFNIQWNFFLNAIHHGQPTKHQIALTFDDGPHPIYTPQVLALLEAHGVQATFFCIGKHVTQYPELLEQLDNQGHIVANHTFTHAATIDFHSTKKWLQELRETDVAIANTIGKTPLFFRPPYGVTTPHLANAIDQTGHTAIGWRVRPYDTLQRPPLQIVKTILKQTQPGDIILLHDTHDQIAATLEQLLPELKKRKFEMVTMDKLIQQHAYTDRSHT